MAQVLVKDQERIKYTSISVAQINEALVTYGSNQSIAPGLTALKSAIIAAIEEAAPCVQCGGANATGKITVAAVVYICPLCNGNTKTEGQYTPIYPPATGYSTS